MLENIPKTISHVAKALYNIAKGTSDVPGHISKRREAFGNVSHAPGTDRRNFKSSRSTVKRSQSTSLRWQITTTPPQQSNFCEALEDVAKTINTRLRVLHVVFHSNEAWASVLQVGCSVQNFELGRNASTRDIPWKRNTPTHTSPQIEETKSSSKRNVPKAL